LPKDAQAFALQVQDHQSSVFRCTGCWAFLSVIPLLSKAEWHILVLNHMHNLSLHCQDKEHNPITEEYWPEDRNIEYREEGHDESNEKCFRDGIPETRLVG